MTTPTTFDAGSIFSGKASGTKLKGYDLPSEYTPASNPDYAFSESARDVILWFLLERPDPLWISGPTGCGKSSLVREIAARLNYPLFEVTGHERLEVQDLIGHLSLRNNSMVYEYGPLALAMQQGGIFLLNEIDLCSPATLAGLNTILDGAPLCIVENQGEIIQPNPMYRFITTANSNGGSDDTGLYQGVLRQNLAFMDRFMVTEMAYPQPDTEINLITAKIPQLPPDTVKMMVDFANDVRGQFMGSSNRADALDVTLSTRTLLRWASLTVAYLPLASQGISPVLHALDRALVLRASPVCRTALRELASKYFATY